MLEFSAHFYSSESGGKNNGSYEPTRKYRGTAYSTVRTMPSDAA